MFNWGTENHHRLFGSLDNILDTLMTTHSTGFWKWLAKRGIKKAKGIPATHLSGLDLGLKPQPKDYTGRMGPMGQPEETQSIDNGVKNEVRTYNIPLKWLVNVVNEIVLISGWTWRQRG